MPIHVGDSVWIEYKPFRFSVYNTWVKSKVTSIVGPTFILDDIGEPILLRHLEHHWNNTVKEYRWELPLQK